MNLTAIVGLVLGTLLALSVAGNAWQYHQHDKDVAEVARVDQLSKDTKAAADACSKSVDGLAAAGKKQTADTLAAIAGIRPQVERLGKESIAALSAKPANPNDLCGSLQLYLSTEIKAERAAK